jgi:hypothetical protein
MAIAFVDGFRILRRHHDLHAVQRYIADAAVLHFVADDEVTHAFARVALELAVAAMSAAAGFDAFGLDPVRSLRRHLDSPSVDRLGAQA